jgi:2,3-bisphosphoglycerate-independent phosphoglycerate mutase
MKSVIIIGDGMSDRPVAALGGKTPLMVADTPHFDRLARSGRMGLFISIPPGKPLGSDVANMSVLGYDPSVCQGRAVLEAASIGVDLDPNDVALRCNLIALHDGCIKNHSAGHIPTDKAAELIRALDSELGNGQGALPVRFHVGVSYRHLLVLEGGWASPNVDCAPPHDHVGARITDVLPKPASPEADATAARLRDLYEKARPILLNHPVNLERRAGGHDMGEAIWPWSPGRRPKMETLQQLFGVRGAVITAVDLIVGLGRYAGMERIAVEGATGLHDTNYEGKAQACLDALEQYDLVYVHVEASDEASHARDLELKIRCIEYLDRRLVGPVLEGISRRGIAARVALLPDHPTPVELGTHAGEPVPFAITGSGIDPDGTTAFDEDQAGRGAFDTLEGDQFIRAVLGK